MSLLLLFRPQFEVVPEEPPVVPVPVPVPVAESGGGVVDERSVHGLSAFLKSSPGRGVGWGRDSRVRVRSSPPVRVVIPRPPRRTVDVRLVSSAGTGAGWGLTARAHVSAGVVSASGAGGGWGKTASVRVRHGEDEDALMLTLLGVL